MTTKLPNIVLPEDRRPLAVTEPNGRVTIFGGGERARKEVEAALSQAEMNRLRGTSSKKYTRQRREQLIPRIFHSVWLGPNRMPSRFEDYLRGWQQKHPGWTMMRWSEENLPRMINQRSFDRVTNWSTKADLLRYEVLLRYGGVYIDTDLECCQSIEGLLGGVEAFAAWQDEHLINIAIMGFTPWHPAMADVIGGADHSRRTLTRVRETLRFGPDYFTQVIKERHPEVTLFPADYFYPYHWTQAERDVTPRDVPRAYAIHHWTLSGIDGKSASVILPTGGDTLRLRWVLEGLCRQRGIQAPWEVIIINDGKQEADVELKALVAEFESRLTLRYVFAGPPRSTYTPAIARNAGIAVAANELLVFLDQDCIPAPDFVRQHQIAQNAGLCAAYGQRWHLPETKVRAFDGNWDFDALVSNVAYADKMRMPSGIAYERWWTSNASVMRQDLIRLGGFDERFRGWGGEDIEVAERLHRLGIPFKALETCWVLHLDHTRVPIAADRDEWEEQVLREDRPLIANGAGPKSRRQLPHHIAVK